MKISLEWSELIIERGKLDPLGIWRVGDRLISELLSPFTTVVMQRPARYFSMYCWILGEARRQLPENAKDSDFWNRFFVLEGIFLCSLNEHSPHDYASFGGRIGQDRAVELLQSSNSEGVIDFSVLERRKIRNGWEVNYKRAMGDFALTAVDYGVLGRLALTDRGKALAAAYQKSISDSAFFREFRNSREIPRSVLADLGRFSCPCLLKAASSAELEQERNIVKQTLLSPTQVSDPAAPSQLWTSIHLILDVLRKVHPKSFHGYTWRRILTSGVLRDCEVYSPPAPDTETFRNWQFYAIDSLFTYAVESGLTGFLEELHGSNQMTDASLRRVFSRDLLPNADREFRDVIQNTRKQDPASINILEGASLNAIENVTKKRKTVAAFNLFCFCQARYLELVDSPDYKAAATSYAQRGAWDGQELSLVQSTKQVTQFDQTVYDTFFQLFLKEWVIARQLEIRTRREKELAWFSYNAETKTYDWENSYNPVLYRADRLPNLLSFLENMAVVEKVGNEWQFLPGSLEATP